MRRFLAVIALSASVTLAGCVNKDGSTDWGSTLAVGAGIGLGAALIAVAASGDGGGRHRDRGYARNDGRRGYASNQGRYYR
ncbi:hypothetical protein [Plastoroseomonas arctica]|uniref:Lipoprotein n=1 Tax=Plastoroseomonas arctica TaxID=1509237 RepID=A0AAF1KM88_9PROT|nr:hypothetical protein [Plastoroseomonas arctica]MBR0656006.1 hypothetical protein [Plastoroseomonas arctica]